MASSCSKNGISEAAGIQLHPRTKGPIVDESYQTNIKGIFACGNALHVHDLVDFVTEESIRTGKAVSRYIKNELTEAKTFDTEAKNGISYIVPQKINASNLDKKIELFMRVNAVHHDTELIVKGDGKEIRRIKKQHMAPAEMEKVVLAKKQLEGISGTLTVEVK